METESRARKKPRRVGCGHSQGALNDRMKSEFVLKAMYVPSSQLLLSIRVTDKDVSFNFII